MLDSEPVDADLLEPESLGSGTRDSSGPSITARARVNAQPSAATTVLAQAEERFLERRRHRLRRILWQVLAWLGGVAVVAGIGYLLFFSDVLTLHADKVTVQEQGEYVDAEAVANVVRTEAGVPLARINAGPLKDQILQLTGVLDARIDRSWPNGMTVTITARVPVVANPTGEGYQLLDDTATQIAVVAEPPPGVVIARLTDRIDADTVAAVLTVLESLPPELAGQVEGIEAADATSVTLQIAGIEVRWGDATNNELKAAVTTTLMAQVGPRFIDVSNPESPITR